MKKPVAPKLPYVSFTGHGIDIASKRADDLDRLAQEYFLSKEDARVLDLGCGAGGHSVRLSKVGVAVTAIDEHDFSHEFSQYRETNNIPSKKLEFIVGDITRLYFLVPNRSFTDAYMQRTLHYLPYQQARELLKFLYKIVEDRLYLSVTGIMSEVGSDYQGNNVSLEQRFFLLEQGKAEIFSIFEPVCLYSKDEFVELLEDSGWKVERCWVSAFGNIKAICTH